MVLRRQIDPVVAIETVATFTATSRGILALALSRCIVLLLLLHSLERPLFEETFRAEELSAKVTNIEK